MRRGERDGSPRAFKAGGVHGTVYGDTEWVGVHDTLEGGALECGEGSVPWLLVRIRKRSARRSPRLVRNYDLVHVMLRIRPLNHEQEFLF